MALKKTLAFVLSLVMTFSVFSLSGITFSSASAQTTEVDVTPRLIDFYSYDENGDPIKDSNGNTVLADGMDMHEICVSNMGDYGYRYADKVLFNENKALMNTQDGLENSTYYKAISANMTEAEAKAEDFSDAADAPETPAAGDVVVTYNRNLTYFFSIETSGEHKGEVYIKTVDKIYRTQKTYSSETSSSSKTTVARLNATDNYVSLDDASWNFVTSVSNGVQYVNKFTCNGEVVTINSSSAVKRSPMSGSWNNAQVEGGNTAACTSLSTIYAGVLNTSVDTSWNDHHAVGEETSCYIDLGAYYVITGALMGGTTSYMKFELKIGDPGCWKQLVNIPDSKLNFWGSNYYVNISKLDQQSVRVPNEYKYDANNEATYKYKNATRYLYIGGYSGNISEMGIYGYKVGELTDYDKAMTSTSYNVEYNSENFNSYNPETSTYNVGNLAKLRGYDAENYDYIPNALENYLRSKYVDKSQSVTAGDSFGANSMVDPNENINKLGNVRIYTPSHSITSTTGFLKLANYTHYNINQKYADLNKSSNTRIIPCIQFTTKFVIGNKRFASYSNSRNWVPIQTFVNKLSDNSASDGVTSPGVDPYAAVSYSKAANFYYNYAAHFGSNKNIDKSTLSIAGYNQFADGFISSESNEVGLGYLKTIEDGNENDNNWSGSQSYTSPWKMAARISAAYDGDSNSLFLDSMGNSYKMVNINGKAWLTLEGIPVATVKGYTMELADYAVPTRVINYSDANANEYDVIDGIAYIFGEAVGTVADADDGTATLTLSKKIASGYSSGDSIALADKKQVVKLKVEDENGTHYVGNLTDFYMYATDKLSGEAIGDNYTAYIQSTTSGNGPYTYFASEDGSKVYYDSFNVNVGKLSSATTIQLSSSDGTGAASLPSLSSSNSKSVTVKDTKKTVHYGVCEKAAEYLKKDGDLSGMSIKIDFKPCGAKIADNTIQFANGGLCSAFTEFIEQMYDWFCYNRSDGYFAVDIYNVHNYMNTTPVNDERFTMIKSVTAALNKYAPGREEWVSEFGTDSFDQNLKESINTVTVDSNGAVTSGSSVTASSLDTSKLTAYTGKIVKNNCTTYNGTVYVGSGVMYKYLTDGSTIYEFCESGGLVFSETGDKLVTGSYTAPNMANDTYQYDSRRFMLIQSNRLVQYNLVSNANGATNGSMFELYDLSGVYANSGLTTNNYSDKMQMYYFATGRNVLSNVYYDKENSKIQNIPATYIGQTKDDKSLTLSPTYKGSALGKSQVYKDMTAIVYDNYKTATSKPVSQLLDTDYYVSQNFVSKPLTRPDNLEMYRYVYNDKAGDESVAAVWLAYSDLAQIENYKLDVSDLIKKVKGNYHITLIEPEYGSMEGKKTELHDENGIVTLNLSTNVVYVKVQSDSVYESYGTEKMVPSTISLGSASASKGYSDKAFNFTEGKTLSTGSSLLNEFSKLIDEPAENVPQYVNDIQKDTSNTMMQFPSTRTTLYMVNDYSGGGYDMVLNFDDYYYLDEMYLFSMAGAPVDIKVYDNSKYGVGDKLGAFEISGGAYNKWLRADKNMDYYGNNYINFQTTGSYITAVAGRVAVNSIRVVWATGGANLGDIVLFGHKAYEKVGKSETPHFHENTHIVRTEPTCTEQGTETIICDDCGETLKTSPIAKLGHDYKAETVVPTPSSYGYTVYTCSRCGNVYGGKITKEGDGNYSGGTGTATDPYLISTAEDFNTFYENCAAVSGSSASAVYGYGLYFRQTSDINMDDIEDFLGFCDEGTTSTGFSGVYDGEGHTITVNSYVKSVIDKTSSDARLSGNTSVFPYTYGVVMNLTFSGFMNGNCTQPFRSIRNTAMVVNCSNKMEVYGTNSNGLSKSIYGKVYNNYIESIVHCTTDSFTSYLSGGTVKNCYNGITGNASATNGSVDMDSDFAVMQLLNKSDILSTALTALQKYSSVYTSTDVFNEWEQDTENYCLTMENMNFCDYVGHMYDKVTEGNTTNNTCKICGFTYSEINGEHIHVYDTKVTKIATCTDDGLITHTCEVCGDTYNEIIPALGHTPVTRTVEPSCTRDGGTSVTCSVCGTVISNKTVPALGHSFDNETVIIAATCTTDGVTAFKCTRCGETKEIVIPATGHTLASKSVSVSCTSSGGTQTYCTVCGEVIAFSETEAALGHSFVEKKNITGENSYTFDVFVCSRCGKGYRTNLTTSGAGTETKYSGGVGTQSDPYMISTAEDFYNFSKTFSTTASATSYYFKQINDIDMTGYEGYVGTDASGSKKLAFFGTYDGLGHSLTVNINSAASNLSIFPYLDGVIKNLTFKGSLISTAASYVQPVRTIQADGTVINCSSDLQLGNTGNCSGLCVTLYGVVKNFFFGGSFVSASNAQAMVNKEAASKVEENCYCCPTSATSYSKNGCTLKSDLTEVASLLNEFVSNKTEYSLRQWDGNDGSVKMLKQNICDIAGHYFVGGVCIDCGEEDETSVLLGDANSNGKVTLSDAVLLARYAASWDNITIQKSACDLNSDGNINIEDVVILSKFLSLWKDYKTLPKI